MGVFSGTFFDLQLLHFLAQQRQREPTAEKGSAIGLSFYGAQHVELEKTLHNNPYQTLFQWTWWKNVQDFILCARKGWWRKTAKILTKS